MAERASLKKQKELVTLDAGGIDKLSEHTENALSQASVNRKDVVRLRLAIEEILSLWRAELGDGAVCTFRCGTRMGKMYIELMIPGRRIDPGEADGEEAHGLLYSNLLAQAGLSPVYSYRDGANRLTLYPPRPRRMSPLAQLLLAFGAAVICGLACLALPPEGRQAVSGVVDPAFDALMGILQALAGPLIFLSVSCGIMSIGSIQVLGRIGRKVIARFVAAIFLITFLTALCLIWLFHPQNGGALEGANAAAQIYEMLLNMIPADIITPFAEGNSLQIIFLAVCVGLVLLVLKDKVPAVCAFAEQANTVVQFMMETVSRYIPVFTFVSLFALISSNAVGEAGGIVKGVLLGMGVCGLCPLIYALAASIRLKVPYRLLIRKQLPAYLIALSTASSAAVLSVNLETCEHRLGISGRIVNFAVPMGQVIFKTGAAAAFFVMAMSLAELYGVAMPLPWVVTGALTAGLLAIAAPPIPGGSLTCYTVLLAQLGIPAEAIALAIAGNVILDFFMTSCGISCLQSELILAANRLGMMDREILKKE